MKRKLYARLGLIAMLFLGVTSSVFAQNLALGKTVVASSFENINLYPATAVNDKHGTAGETDPLTGLCTSGSCTRWSSQATDPQWIYIDLATQYNVTGVNLYWEAASGQNFTIDVSNDATSWTTVSTITGNTAFINNITFAGHICRYVRMSGTARTTANGYSLWEFEINGTIVLPLGPNLAAGKPTTTSSSQFSGVDGSHAVDGQGGASEVDYIGSCTGGCTIWASNAGNDPEWIYVDLGGAALLRQAILYWRFFSAASFNIDVSNDATSWTTVSTVSANTAYVNTIDLASVAGTWRYVRVFGTSRTTSQDYELYELEVYATAFVPLPVTIANFSAVKQGSSAKIAWTTNQETNTKNFVVERSVDGANWAAIATVNAQGNSNTAVNYSIVDANPAKGANLYRLKSVDLDNKFDYSATRKVDFDTKFAYTIYPNPVTNTLQITVDNATALSADLQVLNTQSQVMISKKINTANQPVQLDVSSLKAGLYFMKIVSSDGTVSMDKFVKQ